MTATLIYTCPDCGWVLFLPAHRTHIEAQNASIEHAAAAHPKAVVAVVAERDKPNYDAYEGRYDWDWDYDDDYGD